MPHSTGQQLSRCLLVVLALSSPLFVQGSEGKLAPVVDLNPRHNEAASPSLEEPKTLIVAAEAVPLPTDSAPPAIRAAAPFDPNAETHPRQETGRAHARQDAAALAPVIRVYEPIRPAQQPRFSKSSAAPSTVEQPNKQTTALNSMPESVHRSVFLATRTDRLQRTNAPRTKPVQSHDILSSRILAALDSFPRSKSVASTADRIAAQLDANHQPSAPSAPRLSGFVQFAERDPVTGKSKSVPAPRPDTRILTAKSPRKSTPVVTQAPLSPIEARPPKSAIVSSPDTQQTRAVEEVSSAQPSSSQKLALDVAASLTERNSSVVELATNPIIPQSPNAALPPPQASVSQSEPVLKLAEQQTLPERTAPTEAMVHTPVPTARAKPFILFADAEPLLAVLQPSPSASDLPAPTQEPPLTEEQIAIAEEIKAFELDLKPINELSVRTKPEAGEMPRDHATARFARAGEVPHPMGYSRAKMESEMMWAAPSLCHRPLYFEEVNLERHGYKIPVLQPALSAAHFFGRVPLLPYLMVSEGHRQCQYTLGHYQPGDYAPYSLYVPRMRLDASAAEVAVAAGLIFAIP